MRACWGQGPCLGLTHPEKTVLSHWAHLEMEAQPSGYQTFNFMELEFLFTFLILVPGIGW